MAKRKLPETSLAAFKSLQSEEMIKTYNDILAALSVLGEGTTEDVAKLMKCHPSKVWRRFSELHEKFKLIHRPGTQRVLKSGRKGYTWKLNPEVEPLIATVDRVLPGKTVSDYSKAFNQPVLSKIVQQQLF